MNTALALVKGFSLIVWNHADPDRFLRDDKEETLFAVYANGDVWQSPTYIGGTNEFNPKGAVWKRAGSLPEGAEFIGNYHAPA